MRGGYLLMLMLLSISGTGALAAHVRPVANAAELSAPAAPESGLDQAAAVRASRAVIGQQPADYTLQDRANQPRAWSQFRGRPVLVNFIYTGCFHVCPTSTRALHQAVAAMRERFGTDQFQVLSIGFNPPSDSPAALREFAAQQQIDDPNWEFLSPRAADVPALARDFGFSYVPTLMGFDHTLQVSLVDANG
ncbi:MAG: hypothetical protein CO182_01175, partial [Lysobacterales bacterium CG_4_9_14_3_um_filter_62_6]